VKSTNLLHTRTRKLLKEHPVPFLFPSEPWDQQDLEEIAYMIEKYVVTANEVVVDNDPYSDWLDRWYFVQSQGGKTSYKCLSEFLDG